MTIRRDAGGQYAWIETRLPGGWFVNRLCALGELRRQYPGARCLRIAERWHVPFRHYAHKVYFTPR